MSVHVFVGPTLSRQEVAGELEAAEVFGPAAFGDVYRSVKARPEAIAIIDGYFERVPATWHKEILWAMSGGVHVFGASSMGALRAAELADFGMQGVGAIYEAYRSGALEDDDEVAIVHGPPEGGFVVASEAMVNVRATLRAAVAAGVIEERTGDLLVRLAKARFYAERSYASAIREAELQGGDVAQLRALREWLPGGTIDQKAADARLLLRHIREWLRSEPKALRVNYRFESTDAWLEASRAADASGESPGTEASTPDESLEEELKLAGLYWAARDGAAVRAAAVEEGRRGGFRADPSALGHAAEELRRELGLAQRKDFEAWRNRERIDDADLVRLFEEQAQVIWARPRIDAGARAYLVDWLRVTGRYGRLVEKAEIKARRLAPFGPRGPSLSDLGMTEAALWEWYFETNGREAMPDDIDQFARQAGFADKDDMRSAVLRELCCARSCRRP
jgi:hypothetical protein